MKYSGPITFHKVESAAEPMNRLVPMSGRTNMRIRCITSCWAILGADKFSLEFLLDTLSISSEHDLLVMAD